MDSLFWMLTVLIGVCKGQTVVRSHWPPPTQDYLHMVELDETGRVYLYWKFDAESITMEVHGRTEGWVAVGISPSGSMRGADIVLGGVKDGVPYLEDRYATENVEPELDVSQDVELLDAKELQYNGHVFTMVKFRRSLSNCDPQDRDILEGTVRVIYAMSESDIEPGMPAQYHGPRRGTRSLLLLDHGIPEINKQHNTNQLQHFDLIADNVRLPTNRTTYWCQVFKLPEVTYKQHIVKISPIVTPGNEAVVHHLVAFFCYGDFVQEDEGVECLESGMPENATDCDTVAYAWAVGQGDMYLPEEVGMPMGGHDDSKFMSIQIHYDNPEHLDNIVDSSGFRFHYSDVLRPYDMGTIMVGHTLWWPPLFIPPGVEEFNVEAFCNKDCTQKFIPKDGINVFGAFVHTHLLGRRIVMRHFRDGVEQEELVREDYYDFNFQFLHNFKLAKKILPGDDLLTTCVYNSKNQINVTFGGFGTDNEMCLIFLYYYPRMPLTSCSSSTMEYFPVHQLVMNKAMTGELHIDPKDADEKNVYSYLNEIKWTKKDVQLIQKQVYQATGYEQTCSIEKSGDGVFGGTGTTYQKKIKQEKLLERKSKCETAAQSSAAKVYIQSLLLVIVFITTCGKL